MNVFWSNFWAVKNLLSFCSNICLKDSWISEQSTKTGNSCVFSCNNPWSFKKSPSKYLNKHFQVRFSNIFFLFLRNVPVTKFPDTVKRKRWYPRGLNRFSITIKKHFLRVMKRSSQYIDFKISSSSTFLAIS